MTNLLYAHGMMGIVTDIVLCPFINNFTDNTLTTVICFRHEKSTEFTTENLEISFLGHNLM